MHFATACATAAVGLAYAHAVHLVVPPGALRLVCFAPCVAANALLPVVYMDPLGEDSSVVACAVAAAAFGWWTNFKLLALASGRGQLVGHASLPMFLAVGALPIRLDPAQPEPESARRDERRRDDDRDDDPPPPPSPSPSPHSHRSAAISALALLAGKLCLLAACLELIPRLPPGTTPANLAYAFALYATLGAIMDASAAVAAFAFGLRLAPHFDKPFIASSASDFWARRWNLVAGGMLRDLVYAPIVGLPPTEKRKNADAPAPAKPSGADDDAPTREEGAPATLSARPSPPPRPSPARRAVACFACFAASGLAHEAILWYLNGGGFSFAVGLGPAGARAVSPGAASVDGRWFWFFFAQAPLVLIERWPPFRRLARKTPTVAAVACALGTQVALGNALFFPPVAESGLDRRVVDDLTRRLRGVRATLSPGG